MKLTSVKILGALFVVLLLNVVTGCGPSKVTITSLIVSPIKVAPNQTITITANIFNSEAKSVDYSAALKINDTKIETKEIPVGPGGTETVSFQYSTSDFGIYSVDVNDKTGTFEVVKPAEFEIGSITINPEEIVIGKEISIGANIENVGELSGAYTARLVVDGEEVSTQEIDLDPASSQAVNFLFSLHTSGVHTIEFCNIHKEIRALKPAEFKATSVSVTPSCIFVWQSATVKATIRNIGEVKDTLPVALLINGSQVSLKTLTLEPDASTSVSFTVEQDSAGYYNINICGSSTSLKVVDLEQYTSEYFYYAISYPPDYTVIDNDPTSIAIEEADVGGIAVLVDKVSVTLTPEQYLDGIVSGKKQQLPDWTISSLTEVVENGTTIGYKYDYSNTVDGKLWIGKGMVIKKGGYGYYIVFTTFESEWNERETIATMCLDSFTHPNISTDYYSSQEIGVSLSVPAEWNVIETGVTDTPLAITAPYDQPAVVGRLYIETVPDGTTAQQYLTNITSSITVIEGVEVVSQGNFTFDNATNGYELIVSMDDVGISAKIRYIVVISGDQAYRLTFSGLSTNMDSQSGVIQQIAKTLVVS